MIRLSIVMPTNRNNLTAISRIAQACSWAGPQTEVIIRDNSGSDSKRLMLAQIENENCHLIVGKPCDPYENIWQAVAKATGDFVYFVCDDDSFFDRAIAELPAKIEEVRGDPSVIGISGIKIVESAQGSSIVKHPNIDSGDPLARMLAYLTAAHPSLIFHSPIRRDVLKWVLEIIQYKPFRYSFDDQIMVLLYLLRGRFVQLERLIFAYDIYNWEDDERGQRQDLKLYTAASLDPAINRLHWFLCAFEGALFIRNLALTPDYPLDQRQAMADYWFFVMFKRFQAHNREDFGSPLSTEADKLCAKLLGATGQLTFEAMLADICQFMALKSPDHAKKYFGFWGNMLDQQQQLREMPAA